MACCPQKYTGTIEKGILVINPGGAYGQVPGIQDIAEGQRAGAGSTLPFMVGNFADVHRMAICMGADPLNLAGKIPNQVAARNPGGQKQFLPLWLWCRDSHLYMNAVYCQIRKSQIIRNNIELIL